MEDERIVEMFWQRNEEALREAGQTYGRYLRAIAGRILSRAEDAEECVNDTWIRAWNAIPPARPRRLAAFLGAITRNLAIDRLRRERSGRRAGTEADLCLEELSECIGEDRPIEEGLAFTELLNHFLKSLPEEERRLFLLRYWYVLSIREAAEAAGLTEGAAAMRLQRTRKKLRDFLQKEGIEV